VTGRPPAILVTTYRGDPGVAEIRREARAGRRPRKDYVELAERTGGLVVDYEHMAEHAAAASRQVALRAGLPAGQVLEAILRRHDHDIVLAWADRLGVPLALLHKLFGARTAMVLASVATSNRKKALPMRVLRLHTEFAGIVTTGTVQLDIAANRLKIPRDKLHLGITPVDERYWTPRDGGTPAGPIVAVGWEERDYVTLLRAARETDLPFELAVGSIAASALTGVAVELGGLPPNVRLHRNLSFAELRELYARARIVVVSLKDAEFDAGSTTITEAMAMERAVVVTRTRGQRDIVADGVSGRYVPPDDPRALRDAIEGLAADPGSASAMGRAGRRLVERHHTLDRYVGMLFELLEAVRRAESPVEDGVGRPT